MCRFNLYILILLKTFWNWTATEQSQQSPNDISFSKKRIVAFQNKRLWIEQTFTSGLLVSAVEMLPTRWWIAWRLEELIGWDAGFASKTSFIFFHQVLRWPRQGGHSRRTTLQHGHYIWIWCPLQFIVSSTTPSWSMHSCAVAPQLFNILSVFTVHCVWPDESLTSF